MPGQRPQQSSGQRELVDCLAKGSALWYAKNHATIGCMVERMDG